MWKLIVIVTCLLAAGCTKSEKQTQTRENPEPARQARAAPTRSAPDERRVIAFLGDSLSEGLGVETGKSFPDQVQKKLESAGFDYRVVNLGISGDTTTGGLGRMESVLAMHPAIVVLELGGNDGLRGVPISSTKANLQQMIEGAQNAGAQVLLAGMTLPPNYGPDYIAAFEKIYRDLSAKYHLRLVPFLMEDIRAQITSKPGLMQRDGIHPTAEGHAIIAETVFRYLRPMLNRGA